MDRAKLKRNQNSRKLVVLEILYRCFWRLATASCAFSSLLFCVRMCVCGHSVYETLLKISAFFVCIFAILELPLTIVSSTMCSSIDVFGCYCHSVSFIISHQKVAAQRTLQIFICSVCVAHLLEKEKGKTETFFPKRESAKTKPWDQRAIEQKHMAHDEPSTRICCFVCAWLLFGSISLYFFGVRSMCVR